MKTPDCVSDAIDNVLGNFDDDNELESKENQKKELEEFCERWFKYGEYVELEVDTIKKTCTVLKQRRKGLSGTVEF